MGFVVFLSNLGVSQTDDSKLMSQGPLPRENFGYNEKWLGIHSPIPKAIEGSNSLD